MGPGHDGHVPAVLLLFWEETGGTEKQEDGKKQRAKYFAFSEFVCKLSSLYRLESNSEE